MMTAEKLKAAPGEDDQGTSPVKGRFERTKPYLTAQQQEDLKDEQRRLEQTLSPNSPGYVRNQIQNRDEMNRQLRGIQRQLETDSPPPYTPAEKDYAVKREQELRQMLTAEMCTQAEMRKNPPGAVDKHRRFEALHKQDVLEWKNIRKRLHTSGDAPTFISRDVSNLESFRPRGGSGELSMDNAQIPGKYYHFPKGQIEAKNVMDEKEAERLHEEKRQLAIRLAEMEATVGSLEEKIEKITTKRGPGRPPKQAEG